jgi:hypothetical protein
MTPEKIEHAIQVAYHSLKFWSEDWDFWRRAGGYLHAELMAAASVRSILPDGEVIERNGYEVLYDLDGQLVPKLAQYPEGPAIYDDAKGEALVAKAVDGDQVAPKVLFWVAARFVESGCAMPHHLRRYVAEALTSRSRDAPPRRRGPDPYAKHARDTDIADAVGKIVRLGFRPTRNRESQNESACSIVAKALQKLGLHVEVPTVEKIWSGFRTKSVKKSVS